MKRASVCILLLCAGLSMATAQKATPAVSEKQDLAVFRLAYYGWDIPSSALGTIDTEIQKVFLDMGRFNMIGMKQRLAGDDIDTFLERITAAKEKNFVIPKQVQLGEVFLTAAEFKRLTQAYTIAIPVVNGLKTEYLKDGNYKASIKAAISFIDVAENKLIGIADISVFGTAKTRNDAVAKAIGAIPNTMQYEVRKIERFRNRTYASTVKGTEIGMKLGKDMGIKVGDEYAVMGLKKIAGESELAELGLVVVKETGEKASVATLLYSDQEVTPKTQLFEIARQGFDIDLLVKVLMGQPLEIWDDEGKAVDIVPGFRVAMVRGFYSIRPFTVLQFPIGGMRTGTYWNNYLMNWLGGAEYALYLGRLTLAPAAALGIGASYWKSNYSGYESEPALSHLGVNLSGRASYLITRDIKLNAEAGLEYWLRVGQERYSSYGGAHVTVSGTYKL